MLPSSELRLFVITIDTEADCSPDWTGSVPESYLNIFLLRERLLPILEKYGAVATLLLNADIIQREAPSSACESLSKVFGWELGAHLHGELVEPYRIYSSPAGIRLSQFQCAYPFEIELQKMKTLTDLFVERFGYRPASFRAGRYGAGLNTYKICLILDYQVDTSVVPYTLLRESDILIDNLRYTHKPLTIYRDKEKSLLEVPITVKPGLITKPSWFFVHRKGNKLNRLKEKEQRLWNLTQKILDKATYPLHRHRWLRPSYSSWADMKNILNWLSRQRDGSIVGNMMFHSNELLEGASPYNLTRSDVEIFLLKIDRTLRLAQDLGFRFVSLAAAAEEIRRG